METGRKFLTMVLALLIAAVLLLVGCMYVIGNHKGETKPYEMGSDLIDDTYKEAQQEALLLKAKEEAEKAIEAMRILEAMQQEWCVQKLEDEYSSIKAQIEMLQQQESEQRLAYEMAFCLYVNSQVAEDLSVEERVAQEAALHELCNEMLNTKAKLQQAQMEADRYQAELNEAKDEMNRLQAEAATTRVA